MQRGARCESCVVPLRLASAAQPTAKPAPSKLLVSAFGRAAPASQGLTIPLEQTATSYRFAQPSCLSLAVTHGIRGAVVGSAFGAAMGMSTAVQSGHRGAAVVSFAAQNAARNAAGFAGWTSVFAASRCALTRARGRHDMANPALAGAFTGALLTVIAVRGHWRFAQSQIATNAAASAMIAVAFHALNQM